ncbi:MAG: hypothetical protein [Caudoviricetes sp.]|nr:MAG: hypothetical protein [Caudoviricetes sp.]
MDELNNFEELETIHAKGHYETVKEYYKEIRTYDSQGNYTGTEQVVTGRDVKWVWDDQNEIKKEQYTERSIYLKAELATIKEDIEQETFGLVRGDYSKKKARAAEIINELRVLEGKAPREVRE